MFGDWWYRRSNRALRRSRSKLGRPWVECLEDRCTPTTVTLTPVADNTLYETTNPNGQLSNGAGQNLYAGKTGPLAANVIRRALLRFDLSSIPAGATINSATLQLHMSKSNTGSQTVTLHRASAGWGESTSNAGPGSEGDGTAALPGDATWLYTSNNTQSWANPGGDFVAAASASTPVGGIANYQWAGAGVLADVQAWLSNSSTNFGWLLKGNESANQTAKQFDSRENVTASNRPALTIDYTVPEPDLTIAKSHTGNFTQGDPGDTYAITVTNAGPGPTAGTVTVIDTLPPELTPTAANSGTINGWAVSTSGQTVTATRSDALASGDSYPPLTLTVAVAANAPSSVTNTATVSGGGELNTANNSADDPTTIFPIGDLTITKSHTGDFTQGDPAATYTITVTNVGTGTAGPLVTVTDTLPIGLTPTAANNGNINGWGVSTSGQTITATRLAFLPSMSFYPVLTLTVAVALDAPPTVTNTATVSGQGEVNTSNNSASDPTTIIHLNRAPVNTLPTLFTGLPNTTLALAGVSVTDEDAGSSAVSVTLSVTSGTLTLSTGVSGGVGDAQVTGSGTASVVVTAPLSAINTTLADASGLTFTPDPWFIGNLALTMTTDDQGNTGAGGAKASTNTSFIRVLPPNQPPVNTLPPSAATTAGSALPLTGISVTDPDAGSGIISVTLAVADGTLAVNTSASGGVDSSEVAGNHSGQVVLLSTLARINATLAAGDGLVYTPSPGFAGTDTLTLTTNDLGNTGAGGSLSDTDTESISVTRVVSHFRVDVPAGAVAGVPFTVTVTALDPSNFTVTTYGGAVNLTSSDAQASLLATLALTSGSGSFTATLRTAGSQAITAADSAAPSLTGQGATAVSAASAVQLRFRQQPTATTVKAPFLPVVSVAVLDAFGNVVTTDNTDVVTLQLQSTPGGPALTGVTSVTLASGVASFPTVQLSKPGAGLQLLASSGALAGAVSDPFTVAGVARFTVTTTQAAPVTAGGAVTVTVRAVDAKGNLVTGYGGKVHFSSNDPQAALPADAELTNGEGTFTVMLRTAGGRTVAVADLAQPRLAGGLKKPVTVTPAAVASLAVSGFKSPAPTGKKQPVAVSAVDAFGNVTPGYVGVVTVSSSDPLVPPATFSFGAKDRGKHTFSVALSTAGLQSISASDGTRVGSQANIVVFGPAVTVREQPDGTALVVVGTAGPDTIVVRATNPAGTQLEVLVNGVPQGPTFSPSGYVLVFGVGGDDAISLRAGVMVPAVIDGGAGKDTVDASGSGAANVLVGGADADTLTGGSGQDILLGGSGGDLLHGGGGDDVLSAGPTTLDADLAALLKLMAEWGDPGKSFLTRVQHTSGNLPGGANQPFVLNGTTAQKDPLVDQLFGDAGSDWFLYSRAGKGADQVKDPLTGEVLFAL